MKTIQNIISIFWLACILQGFYFIAIGTPVIIAIIYISICTLISGMLLYISGFKGGIK
tara:strand:+ start:356 stop:529 length:174 start_codon:yes stop_codon:yes gene_type:complete